MDVRAHRGVSRQRLHVRSALSALLVLCPLSGAARADEVAAPAPTRALKLGASAQYLVGNPFAGRSSNAGPGLAATYEFLLSPRFALGIALGYKQYFGTEAVGVVVYGLVLKHYLLAPPPGASAPALRPYLQYGLLQQIIHQRGHSGAAVAYDAGLMAGTDFALGPLPLFVEGAFHVSHLSFIDLAPRNQSYLELGAGARIVW
jgi:hypothetical protein